MKYTINNNWHSEAIKQMEAIVQALPDLKETDIVSLDLLGDALDTFNNAVDGIKQTGLVITNAQNNLVTTPYMKIKNDAQIAAFKIMKQFGLNPMDHKKLNSDNTEEEESLLSEFMKGE